MKKTKWLIFVCMALFLIGTTACSKGGGKYADLKDVVVKFNQNTQAFVDAMDKADSAESVAAAMNDFAAVMGTMKTDMQKMEEKYPEIKDMENPPAELAEEGAMMQELMMKMGTAMMKAMQYGEDPAVKAAQEALQNIMR